VSDTEEPAADAVDDRPALVAQPRQWQPPPFPSELEVTFYVVNVMGQWGVSLGGRWMECNKP
jgi:hypothetical protein